MDINNALNAVNALINQFKGLEKVSEVLEAVKIADQTVREREKQLVLVTKDVEAAKKLLTSTRATIKQANEQAKLAADANAKKQKEVTTKLVAGDVAKLGDLQAAITAAEGALDKLAVQHNQVTKKYRGEIENLEGVLAKLHGQSSAMKKSVSALSS